MRLAIVVFGLAYMAYEPWLLTLLWRWFAVPSGAPVIGFWQMAGLNLLVAVFTWRFIPKGDDLKTKRDVIVEQWAVGVSTLVLGFAFSFGVAQ